MPNLTHNRKQKIIFAITKGNFGGAQRYVLDMATSLSQERFDVLVVLGEGTALEQKLATAGIRTVKLASLKRDINLWLELKVFFSLISLFLKEKPDIIHVNSSKIGGLGAFAGRVVGVPRIIFTAHAWAWNEDRNIISKLLIAISHWCTVVFTHKTIAVSADVARQMSRLPFISRKVAVIHNGINPFTLKSGFEARQILAPHIRENTWIGTISELHKNKGLDFLIEAFARIASEFTDTVLVIIGTGEERDALETIIAKKKLQHRVHLVGFVENAKIYLKAFDIFTLTSRTEALPYVLPEAGFASLPVIASAVGGIPEVIKHNASGLLVNKGDIDAIEKNLSTLLSNEVLRAQLGSALKEKVTRDFSQERMVKETAALYN